MMRKNPARIRVLSIDPTSRGFGFAVLEGSDSLIDWGVVQARTDKSRQCLKRIQKLIEQYRPRIIVIEDTRSGSRRGPRVRRLLESIEKLASNERIRVRRVLQKDVMRFFCEDGERGKHKVAVEVARRFPELARCLPPARKPWKSEPEIMAVFDAAAFALAL